MSPRWEQHQRKVAEAAAKADEQLRFARHMASETNRLADNLDETKRKNHIVEGLMVSIAGDGLIDKVRKMVSSWVRP